MIFCYWLGSLLPGLVVGYSLAGQRPQSILSLLAVSHVASVAVLTPIVAVAFALNLSSITVTVVFSLIALASVGLILAVGEIRRYLRGCFSSIHWASLVIVVVAVAAVAVTGAPASWDHPIHAGKVLFMREYGFLLQDPYSPVEVIESRHHVNTYHALHVVGSRLLNFAPFELWMKSAWFIPLLAAGSAEFLAMRIFTSRWAASNAAALAVIPVITSRMLPIPVPSAIATWVILPVLIVAVLHALREPAVRSYLWLAAASVAMATVHTGFWLITLLCTAPVILLAILLQRTARELKSVVYHLSALMAGLPLLVITALQPTDMTQVNQAGQPWEVTEITTGGLTLHMMNPIADLWLVPVCLGLLVIGMAPAPQRRERLLTLALVGMAMMLMFNPIIFEPLSRIVPHWMIKRSSTVIAVIAVSMIPAGLTVLLESQITTAFQRILFVNALFCAVLLVFEPGLSRYRSEAEQGRAWLTQTSELSRVLSPFTSDRPLIAADPNLSNLIPASTTASVMSPRPGGINPADTQVGVRRAEAVELISPATTQDRRRQIVLRRGVDFILIRTDDPAWPTPPGAALGDRVAQGAWFAVYNPAGILPQRSVPTVR